MAFPKTGDARDLLMASPSEISPKQLKELKLKIDPVRNTASKNASDNHDSEKISNGVEK
jgi:hypothetical protein